MKITWLLVLKIHGNWIFLPQTFRKKGTFVLFEDVFFLNEKNPQALGCDWKILDVLAAKLLDVAGK